MNIAFYYTFYINRKHNKVVFDTMAYLGNVTPPSCIGFVRNPNLVLPLYILTEVNVFRDENGLVVTHRRPRPLSVIAGAEVVLQSDPERLARYVGHEIK